MTQTLDTLRLVQTTLATEAQASALAEDLIGHKLAACAQIAAGLQSIYPWQGRIERASEVLLTLKTSAAALPALKARLLDQHPYDVPELMVLPVIETTPDYLDWAQQWIEADRT